VEERERERVKGKERGREKGRVIEGEKRRKCRSME
jgi:hypothetical protein